MTVPSAEPAADAWPPILIALAALVSILPLLLHGCSCGHDFDFHLLNWMEAARQFSQGGLHPHWAYSPAFNAGEPRFVFYPPLSWYLGAALGLLPAHLPGVAEAAGWSAAPVLFTWIALTLSGLTMYRLARAFAGRGAALLAGTLYLANPYMLFTAYERTAYAELLAAAWIPLLFAAILRDRVSIPRIALPVALLWLTNAPAAVMGSYTLALLAALRVVSTYRMTARTDAPGRAWEAWIAGRRAAMELALKTLAGTALGLGLAAFYIVPAAYERRFVQISMATIAGMRIDENFLFEHTGATSDALPHDTVLHTASVIAVVLLGATAAVLGGTLILRRRAPSRVALPALSPALPAAFPVLPLGVLTAVVAWLLTPLSAPIWKHAPEAAFLQFPWRLLAIVAPVLALGVAGAVDRLKRGGPGFAASRRWVGDSRAARTPFVAVSAVVLAAVMTYPAARVFRQPCDAEDTASARLALFHSGAGSDPTDEYTPTTADNDALKPNAPLYWLADSAEAAAPVAGPSAASLAEGPGTAPMHFTVVAPRAEELILNLRDYPAWRISRNGAPDAAREQRDDGLIAFPIPAGASTIDIGYARTRDQTLGDAVSLLALVFYVYTVRRNRPASGDRAKPA